MQTIVDACGCHASKQSHSRDRGLISSLPIPYCANSPLYVEFIHGLPRFGGYDSCLVVTAGGVHMNGTGDTERTATKHREIPDDGLCMQHCQGGAGTRAPNLEKSFYSGPTTCQYFSPPRGGRRRTEKMYRAGPTQLAPPNTATSRTPARNKSDCASTCCNDEEPTPNRRLTRPHTNKTATANTT